MLRSSRLPQHDMVCEIGSTRNPRLSSCVQHLNQIKSNRVVPMNFSRRSILTRIFLSLTLLAFVGAETSKPAATTQPTTDESARAKEVFTTFVQQGTNALAAGEYPAALESLLDAKQIFERKMRAKNSSVGSPEHVAMLH